MKKLGIVILGILVFGALTIIPAATAAPGSVTKVVDAGFAAFGDIFSIRDTSNPNDQAESLSLDKPTYSLSDNVIITVTNRDENKDSESIESITVTATTPSGFNEIVVLTETGVNSNEFTASMSLVGAQVGEELTVSYLTLPLGVGRADFQFGFDLSGAPAFPNLPDGTEIVVMTDVILPDASACINNGFDIITHPIDFQAPDVISQNIFVTIAITNAVHPAWDNADLADNLNTNFVNVLYKRTGGLWEDLSQGDTSKHDITPGAHPTGTIENVLQPSTVLSSGGTGDASGQYALGIQQGCPGGGGGGLVRPGFVVIENAPILPEFFVIGGEIIPIEATSLILAGAQSFSWMIPVVLSGIGIGLFAIRRR